MTRGHAGFTLVELLVVLALGALFVGMVGVGGAQYLRKATYHDVVRTIGSELRQAQVLSSRLGQDIAVSYDVETKTLDVGRTRAVHIGDSLVVQWRALDANSIAPDSRQPVIFIVRPDRGARGGEFTVIDGTRGVTFSVNWLLGAFVQRPWVGGT